MQLPLQGNLRTDVELALCSSGIRRLDYLNAEIKAQLTDTICSMLCTKTLDNTQRQGFIAALRNPLHCIQGPPGTGAWLCTSCVVFILRLMLHLL